ncbi:MULTISPECIES: serine/threonine-protein kinase [Prauserella salsuginis group]|uniref:non-specific serine/threonine protein kinase n=1 Tax=Prauserella salsuginis TaxID=387889 RepID=A0ABW6G2U1_9PSEU|nr:MULTISPECIES: serine/threonine-protein kinase [Prauserella salsuginis group]MCR3719748.1 Serine/threonine protein kinase [Prauserella flava]MCR3736709.1 Serine/threonine protein kinase [Prauserella salsuginis]
MNYAEGTVVGKRYRLDQPIGRGRAGIVWLAFDTMLHRTVAAKQLYIDPSLTGEAADHARRTALHEARQATRVVHAGAVAVYDAVRYESDVWAIMEYVPCRNMADFLAEHGELTPQQAAYLGHRLGAALATAHAIGVTHRAVEPGNVLLCDDGGVKLTDIGLSQPPADPAYRAPELAKGVEPSPASDGFSLGAMLFAAVEGVPPFGEDGTGTPVVPRRCGALTGALLKLLRDDPELRPTMQDTVQALRAITKGREQGLVPPTAPAMPTVPVLPQVVSVPAPPPPPAPQRTGSMGAGSMSAGAMRTWLLVGAAAVLLVIVVVLVLVL